MSTLAEVVRIERRFARSARLDADLKGTPPLVGYVLQESIKKALTTMAAAQVETRQGAFTWTGPYGGGKSSAALLVGNLVGGGREGRAIARKLAGPELTTLFTEAFPKRSKAWTVVPVTGSRTELRDAIATAASSALNWTDELLARARMSDADLVGALLDSSRANGGLLLILDELGKFLEHAVAAGHGDVHLLQDLAEYSSRSEGRFVIIGILHQAFDQYAGRLSRDARQEWAKVQGRFQDISFLAGTDETVALLGRAIITEGCPPAAAKLAKRVASAVAARRPTDEKSLSNALTATWPLNPVTALILGPMSRQRFAQNERSVFGFLSSAEPYGFAEFLKGHSAKALTWYGPDRLWDYLVANFGMALASGVDSARFSLAFEAIDRATAKGGPLHAALAKCAAVIEVFRNGSGLAVTDEFLQAALPVAPKSAVAGVIDDLLEWAVLLRQPRLGGYAMFAGSDFDLERAVRQTHTKLDLREFSTLAQRVGLGFVVAKRHYFRTGALRAFEIVVQLVNSDDDTEVLAADLGRRRLRGAGLLVLLLADSSVPVLKLAKHAQVLATRLDNLGIVAAVAVASSGEGLLAAASELFTLEKITKEHPQLQGDRIARREIAARSLAYLDEIQRDLSKTLDDADWCIGPSRGAAVRDCLSVVTSLLADAAYPQTPILRSELVQRDRPSSNAMAAVRELGHAMVKSEAQANLGFSGFPAEMGLYLTVLRPFGLHREVEPGVLRFTEPDDSESGRSLRPVWDAFIQIPDTTLDQVYATWAKPPFGLKIGVMPILALASILARREQIALYLENVFQPTVDTFFVDKLLQNPKAVRLKVINRTYHEVEFLSDLALSLGVPGEPVALPVAQAIFQRFQGLPVYAQRTGRLSNCARAVRNVVLRANDPEALLFHDLPALELPGNPAARIMEALIEAEQAYSVLLGELRQALADVLGTDSTSFSGVSTRAKAVVGLTNDLRLDAFSMRVATFEIGRGEIEELASLLVHKPPRTWSDRDREEALFELARFGRRFREAEALAAVRERHSTTEALALIIGIDSKVPALLTSFELTESEREEASLLAEQVLDALGRKGSHNIVRLAALARAVASLAGEGEREAI